MSAAPKAKYEILVALNSDARSLVLGIKPNSESGASDQAAINSAAEFVKRQYYNNDVWAVQLLKYFGEEGCVSRPREDFECIAEWRRSTRNGRTTALTPCTPGPPDLAA